MNITDDEILNIEFYHDNKKNLELIEKIDFFYDTINNKKIYLNKSFKDNVIDVNTCENIIKNILFSDIIEYNKNKLIINNEKYELFDYKNNIYIFDNGALTDTIIKLINDMFNFQSNIKVFIPFIYLCETSIIGNSSFINLIKSIKKIAVDNNIEFIFEKYL